MTSIVLGLHTNAAQFHQTPCIEWVLVAYSVISYASAAESSGTSADA